MINGANNSVLMLVDRQPNIRQQASSFREGFSYVGANVAETIPNLTDREVEILNRIKKAVGGPVKFSFGDYTSACGLTISTLGFNGAGACGTRSPFMITHGLLREMAEDESVYRERMGWIREALHEQNTLETSLADSRRKAEQEDAERKAQQVRMRIMATTDFWNDIQREGQSRSQSNQFVQKMVGSYEQMLSVQHL